MTKKLAHRVLAVVFVFFTVAMLRAQETTIVVDGAAAAHAFPHYWEQMFGSGRAILSLRDGYRQDLRSVKQITDLKYVRFHAIFHDEVGVYDEDQQGTA